MSHEIGAPESALRTATIKHRDRDLIDGDLYVVEQTGD